MLSPHKNMVWFITTVLFSCVVTTVMKNNINKNLQHWYANGNLHEAYTELKLVMINDLFVCILFSASQVFIIMQTYSNIALA